MIAILLFFPILLRYKWHITMRKLKVYNITISHMYILQNDYHIKLNIHHFM